MCPTKPFVLLGKHLEESIDKEDSELMSAIELAVKANHWFTKADILTSLSSICETMLDPGLLSGWLDRYTPPQTCEKIGVVMAGNIPLVGFFDMMCVLAAGHECFIKPSSKDAVMMNYIVGLLKKFGENIIIENLAAGQHVDAIIATGSDNTVRYFKERFKGVPCLFRGHRYSVAVISGDETDQELALLAEDVFTYFGMGCRSVSKIFIPAGFSAERLANVLRSVNISHPGYLSAYRHNKALLRMRGEPFLDGGFFTLRRSGGNAGALPDIIYDIYDSDEAIKRWLSLNDSGLQCVVSGHIEHSRGVKPGRAQFPRLQDYADGADIMLFLGCGIRGKM